MTALALAALVVAAAPEVVLRPCVDQLTVRAEPSVSSPKVGTLTRVDRLDFKGELSPVRTRIKLTLDKNVPAPIRFEPEDAWLKIRLPSGQAGWVFGGAVCRPMLTLGDAGTVSLLGWSSAGHLAFVERAVDSFACGFLAPQTMRVVELTGKEVFRLADGCPGAELYVSHHLEVVEALRKHQIQPAWSYPVSPPTGLKLEYPRRQCLAPKPKPCRVKVMEGARELGAREFSLARSDLEDFPRLTLVTVLLSPVANRRVALMRLQPDELSHAFELIALEPAP